MYIYVHAFHIYTHTHAHTHTHLLRRSEELSVLAPRALFPEEGDGAATVEKVVVALAGLVIGSEDTASAGGRWRRDGAEGIGESQEQIAPQPKTKYYIIVRR